MTDNVSRMKSILVSSKVFENIWRIICNTQTHRILKAFFFPPTKPQRKIFPGPKLRIFLIPEASTSWAAVSGTEKLPRSQAISTPHLVWGQSAVSQLLERPPRVRWTQQWPYVTIMACRVERKGESLLNGQDLIWKSWKTLFPMQKQNQSKLIFTWGGRESKFNGPGHGNQFLRRILSLRCEPYTAGSVLQGWSRYVYLALFPSESQGMLWSAW